MLQTRRSEFVASYFVILRETGYKPSNGTSVHAVEDESNSDARSVR